MFYIVKAPITGNLLLYKLAIEMPGVVKFERVLFRAQEAEFEKFEHYYIYPNQKDVSEHFTAYNNIQKFVISHGSRIKDCIGDIALGLL